MTKCKHWDCGWCYAPDDIKTNATQSGCFEPEHCPYLKSQNQMKSFNINSTVKVRLTKFGKELHKKEWEDLWSSSGRLDKFPYEPPDTDADGYVKFQMWDLMGNLGKYCGWGSDLPFDIAILIDEEDLKEVEIEEKKLLKECRQTGRTTATTEKVSKTAFLQMKETDISKILIEGDTATINGVKYKRVEEPKPKTLYDVIYKWQSYDSTCDKLVDMIEEWLPDRIEYEDEDYDKGWNDALRIIKEKLR